MVKALDMSTKGKVKTGSKSKDEKILNNSSLKSSKIRGTEVVSDELLEKVKLRRDVVIAKEGTDDCLFNRINECRRCCGRGRKYKYSFKRESS